jgi:hypothetical protein
MEFRDFVRLAKTAKLSFGDFRASGPPAVIIALSGLVLAGGLARALVAGAASLPEALREGRALLETSQKRKGTLATEVVRRLDDR